MGLRRIQWGCSLSLSIFFILCFKTLLCDAQDVSVKFLKTPPQSSVNSQKISCFVFEALVGSTSKTCTNCTFNCKLDDEVSSDCGGRNISVSGLHEGYHSLKVCTNAPQGVGCASYNWTVDTVHPTAYISTSATFTSSPNVTVYISFTEPCTGGGGFGCSSVSACNGPGLSSHASLVMKLVDRGECSKGVTNVQPGDHVIPCHQFNLRSSNQK